MMLDMTSAPITSACLLAPVVTICAAVAAPDDPDKLAGSPDGLHPDIEGYRWMAEALLPAITAAAG